MRTAPQEHRTLLQSLLRSHESDKVDRIRNLILPSDSVEYAAGQAKTLIARARAGLATLPESPARQILDTMAEFVITRPM
jgi:geranylgeranyl pyrophosphate synthase